MFTIAKERTFTRTVKVFVPTDDGHREESVKATFRVIPTNQASTYDDDEAGSREFVRAVVVKLDDLVDEQKQPVTYNDEVREALLSVPYVRQALAQAYADAVTKAKAGN
jgi:hypothetical protein